MTEYTAKRVILKDASNNYLIPYTESELPSQASNSGKFLSTDGVNPSWKLTPSGHNLFDFKWADYALNDESWLRSDTFSWQDGITYSEAYNHLVNDQNGRTAETETIGSYTVTFYRAVDGHKICLSNQEETVANIYNQTGIAWYYILDTTNQRFKLPRTKYGFNGYRNKVGNYIPESLPNITAGNFFFENGWPDFNGALYNLQTGRGSSGGMDSDNPVGRFDASRCSSAYQNNAPVQERSTQMYLYFYVGEFSKSATEQTAGLNSELINLKVDISSLVDINPMIKSYEQGNSGYNIWANGYCEQWGLTVTSNQTVTFVKKFKSTPNMTWGFVTQRGAASYDGEIFYRSLSATNFVTGSRLADAISPGFMWHAHGYLAPGQY